MRCANCGSENPTDSTFCEQCGRKIEQLCPACKATVTSSNLFDDLVAEASIASEPDEVALRLDPHFLQKRAPALTMLGAPHATLLKQGLDILTNRWTAK
jgi:hypothetical protein